MLLDSLLRAVAWNMLVQAVTWFFVFSENWQLETVSGDFFVVKSFILGCV